MHDFNKRGIITPRTIAEMNSSQGRMTHLVISVSNGVRLLRSVWDVSSAGLLVSGRLSTPSFMLVFNVTHPLLAANGRNSAPFYLRLGKTKIGRNEIKMLKKLKDG